MNSDLTNQCRSCCLFSFKGFFIYYKLSYNSLLLRFRDWVQSYLPAKNDHWWVYRSIEYYFSDRWYFDLFWVEGWRKQLECRGYHRCLEWVHRVVFNLLLTQSVSQHPSPNCQCLEWYFCEWAINVIKLGWAIAPENALIGLCWRWCYVEGGCKFH